MIIAIGLYQVFTALDAIGPYEVITYLPDSEVVICAEHTGVVDDHSDLVHLRVDSAFADVPSPDALLVPGGPTAAQHAAEGRPIVEWIRSDHLHTTWTTSVCTGALLLGAAGLLDGVPATTHWSAYDDLASYGAKQTEQRVVTSGRMTGAGVSAGIDLVVPRRKDRRSRGRPDDSVCYRIRSPSVIRRPSATRLTNASKPTTCWWGCSMGKASHLRDRAADPPTVGGLRNIPRRPSSCLRIRT